MPRRPRVFVQGGIYHVYNRFARGAEIFREGDESDRFLEVLRKARDRDGLTIFAWCLMSNHYHLAVRVGETPMWRTFGYLQARFAQQYNRRHRSTGPLWQSRFKARLVNSEEHLHQLIAYIHLNPVSASLVDDPGGYSLSGHRELLGTAPQNLLDTEEVLGLYGSSLRKGRRSYLKCIEGARQSEWQSSPVGALPWWRREPDRPLQPKGASVWVDELGRSTCPERPLIDARSFVEAVSEILQVPLAELAGGGSNRRNTHARCLVAALGVERWQQKTRMLAEVFGRRADVVSRWTRWGADRRLVDPEFREEYLALDRALSESYEQE